MVKLVLIFISETLHSSIVVIKHVVSPKITIEPGIFTYKTILTSDREVTTLSLLLTLTPGSVVMEINEAGEVLYVPERDIKRYKAAVESTLRRLDRWSMYETG